MASVTNNLMESNDDYIPPVKLKKTTNEIDHNDLYCFECHEEGDVICCDSCPRVYHPKCLGLITLPDGDWTCPECKTMQSSSNINNHSMNEFHIMLKYALRRMKSHPQAAPFMKPVDSKQMPEYLDYIIHPMDLETIENNIDLKKYRSTDSFIADVKWITHNSVVFNGSQSKFTAIARALLKIARHEMTEIEICSECYLRSAQPVSADWFAEPCTMPHTLCWAKMKGYQSWPAKVLRIVNDEVDVRFFGQHDRAWVSINNCFVLSKEYPGVEKKKPNVNFEKSLVELQTHIDRLKVLYGHFIYAPPQTSLSKTKPFKFVSIIDDSIPPTYVKASNNNNNNNNNNTLRSSIKCAKQTRSPTPQQTTESPANIKTATKRPNENSHEQQQQQQQQQQESVKRARLSSRPSDDNGINSNRIVLRIRKPSEDLSSSRSETLNSSSSSSHQLTIQIKEPLVTLKEEDEEKNESQSLNVFDIFNQKDQTSVSLTKDDEVLSLSPKNESLSPSSSENQLQIQTLPNKNTDQNIIVNDSNVADVRLSINALLDAVDALKSISEVRNNRSLLTTSLSINESRPVQPQFAERRTTIKQPRKSRLQQRIITSQSQLFPTKNLTLPPFEHNLNEQTLSPTPPIVPLRPLSISPSSTDIFEDISALTNGDLLTQNQQVERTTSIETLSVKSEPIDNEEHQKQRLNQSKLPIQSSTPSSSSISTKSFLISPPANTHHHKTKTPISTTTTANSHFSAMIPNSNSTFAPRISSTVSQKNNWSTTVSMNSSTRQPQNTTHKRPGLPIYPPTAQRNSNNNPSTMRITPSTSLQPQSFDAFSINSPVQRRPNGITHPTLTSNTPPIPTRNPIRMPQFNNHPIRPPIDDHQTQGEIQMIIKNFNDKFQQLLADFTVKVETALESNRVKYEKELEETRRTYRMSMNELRTITTQQVQEMHNSLELQYWTRLSEMRNRYESTLQQQQQLSKSSKQLNGGPR